MHIDNLILGGLFLIISQKDCSNMNTSSLRAKICIQGDKFLTYVFLILKYVYVYVDSKVYPDILGLKFNNYII